MNTRFCKIISRCAGGQSGHALIIMLVFLLLGSLTLVPVLGQMATTLKTGVNYENKSRDLYTADAGIETGLWRIKYDFMGPAYDPYDFTTVWPYETDPVNHLTADVYVQNVWLPSNVTLASAGLSAAQAKTMVDSEKLVCTGTSGAVPGQPFYIKMDFTPEAGDNLTIKSIGVWLPQGFTYTAGDSELEQLNAFNPCRPDHVAISPVPGGTSVVWSYNPPYPLFIAFPNYAVEDGTLTVNFAFTYDPPADNPNKMPLAMAWATTDMDPTCLNSNDVPLAWDTDLRYYKITSETGNTEIETYSSKSQLRNLGNGIAGDYVAIGNSVMLDNASPFDRRDTLLTESSTDVEDVSPIPAAGDVLYAYLYWSGFRRSVDFWSDNCTEFAKWTRDAYTRVPVSDNETLGTWNTAPYWDDVNETTANDSNYFTGTELSGGNARQLFNFNPFTVPGGSTITGLTVYVRAIDAVSSGSNVIRPSIKVNGTIYNTTATSNNPAFTEFNTYSYIFATNPNTGSAWTVDDINGVGAHPLQNFGVYSSDLNPDINISMVYAEVNLSYWSVDSSTQFQGQGSAVATESLRTLTMKDLVNLSSYAPGTIALSWTQSDGGTLESSDTLYYALSSDNGTTWGENIIAFQDDISSQTKYVVIPEEYLTAQFKIRFYFNFNDTAEYVYLDNFNLLYMPPDTSITFKIDGEQVYFDGDGAPAVGAQSVNASYSAVLVNETGLDAGYFGYSYACYKDVTDLVQKYPIVPGEQHHNGSYEYTVGDISGDVGQYISYAGWSLIIIYSSPNTAGRYIYLTDIHNIFAFNPGSQNLDFDNDGTGGGDVMGFLFPEPVRDKYGTILDPTAAKITCFVGEGDVNYTGDSLKITGQQSGLDKLLSNAVSPSNNTWNSASPGMSYPGVDVDTFIVLWEDGILTPKDTSLHLDMVSGTDAWNLIFIIMSVRSETVTSGTGHYLIDTK
jgi:hypothetical protein